MSSPFPQLQVLVGFNNNPFDDHTAWTVAAPGVLGAAGVWTDITNDVRYVDLGRGRQHEYDVFQQGTATISLKNEININNYSPWNPGSPYNGKIKPLKKVQVRQIWSGTTYYKYTGFVVAWPVHWPDDFSQDAEIHCEDAFRIFNLALLASNAYSAQVLADGATNYWRCNEPANGTSLTDSGPNNQGMTFVNGSGSTGPPVTGGSSPLLEQNDGASVSFGQWNNGVNGMQYCRSAGAIGFNAPATWSVEFWVLAPVYSSGGASYPTNGPQLIQQTNGGATASQWLISLASGKLNFQTTNSTSGTFAINLNAPTIADGQWHHIVCTYNNGTMDTYVDGVHTGGPTSNTGLGLSSSDTVLIGAAWSGGGAPNLALGGASMSEIAMYQNVALTSTQIANHFRLGLGFITESAGNRILNTSKQIGWPAALVVNDAGNQNVSRPYSSLTTTSALSMMQLVELTEGGAVLMDGQGRIQFYSRQTIAGVTTVSATIGDQAADIPFMPGVELAYDELDIINQCVCTNVSTPVVQAKTQIANNAGSQTSYGLRSKSYSGLLHQSDAAALEHAKWIVNKLAQPVVRMRSVEIDMVTVLSNASKVTTILGLDLLYRVTVERAQVSFTQTALIERIDEHIAPDAWTIKYALSPTDTYATWQWTGSPQ